MDAIINQPHIAASRIKLRSSVLTAGRCRLILIALLALGFFSHLRYLTHDCPIDLAGDEAQYWDWSRQLDLSYYSKGPLVAYIIRASCHFLGETMLGVRFPALLLGMATTIVTYVLTARLFRSERLALGAVGLYYVVPMFVAGSVLMTIDPPFYFCWAAATLCAVLALFENRKWAWIGVGVFVGVGFLAKYAMFLWFAGLLIYMLLDPRRRERLLNAGPWISLFVATLFTIPVIIWNHHHNWVSLKHVAHQTGASGGGILKGNFFEFIGSQIGVLGLISIFMIGAIVSAFRQRRDAPFADQRRFLLVIGLSFFAFVSLSSLLAKAQVNWPAPAYFTLMILTAHFIATRMEVAERWRRWRGWFYATVIVGLVLSPLVHDVSMIFPLLKHTKISPASIDFMAKLRGWKILGDRVTIERDGLDDAGAFVLCDDYMQTAEMAFYVKGQPRTYYAGSYYISDPKRFTQYDMWPDRSLANNQLLLGHNAIYVGKGGELPTEIANAFARVKRLEAIPVIARGATVHTFKIWRCYNFRGMKRAPGMESF